MKSKPHRYFLPCPYVMQTSRCDSDWYVEKSSRESWVTGHAGFGSIDWWVTWVMGHKMWPIVSCAPVYLSVPVISRRGKEQRYQLPLYTVNVWKLAMAHGQRRC